jgi:hypothetical protein
MVKISPNDDHTFVLAQKCHSHGLENDDPSQRSNKFSPFAISTAAIAGTPAACHFRQLPIPAGDA